MCRAVIRVGLPGEAGEASEARLTWTRVGAASEDLLLAMAGSGCVFFMASGSTAGRAGDWVARRSAALATDLAWPSGAGAATDVRLAEARPVCVECASGGSAFPGRGGAWCAGLDIARNLLARHKIHAAVADAAAELADALGTRERRERTSAPSEGMSE